MKLENNYWIDENFNKWDSGLCTESQAKRYSESLKNCTDCISCKGCKGCINCTSCTNCINCTSCRGCISCTDCRGCVNFDINPQRIVSPFIGSRRAQSVFYWNGDKELLICGCFTGSLAEFEEKVKETHGETQYAKEYFNWINAVRAYRSTNKN